MLRIQIEDKSGNIKVITTGYLAGILADDQGVQIISWSVASNIFYPK